MPATLSVLGGFYAAMLLNQAAANLCSVTCIHSFLRACRCFDICSKIKIRAALCSDPAHPKLAGRIWLGGSVRRGGPVRVLAGLPEDTPEAPVAPTVQGHEVLGGPQMIQLRWAPAANSVTRLALGARLCINPRRCHGEVVPSVPRSPHMPSCSGDRPSCRRLNTLMLSGNRLLACRWVVDGF